MSYELIYDKQFIKLDEKRFVPMVLGGSSNCYEWSPSGKERRSRSWFNLRVTENPIATLDEMLKYCKDMRQSIIDSNEKKEKNEWYEEYDDKEFGYWSAIAINGTTRNTTYGRFEGVFKTGSKKALTLEQLSEERIKVVVKNSYLGKNEDNLETFSKMVTTTKEMDEALKECDDFYKGTKIKPIIEFGHLSEDKPKWLRRKYFSKLKK